MASLHKLVNKYEKNSKNPISLDDMSKNTLRQVKGVIGFKITINDIQATYKLSQTRPEDHKKIISELEETNDANACAVAKAMKINNTKKCLNSVFRTEQSIFSLSKNLIRKFKSRLFSFINNSVIIYHS